MIDIYIFNLQTFLKQLFLLGHAHEFSITELGISRTAIVHLVMHVRIKIMARSFLQFKSLPFTISPSGTLNFVHKRAFNLIPWKANFIWLKQKQKRVGWGDGGECGFSHLLSLTGEGGIREAPARRAHAQSPLT